MNPVLRNILAVVAGFAIGSIVNISLVSVGPKIFPPPPEADITTMEGLKATMHLFEPENFIFPFLAHALGTFAGAVVAALIAIGNKRRAAMIVSVLFLAGGIANVFMLPSPMWFNAVDLLLAYLPMGLLAVKLVSSKRMA